MLIIQCEILKIFSKLSISDEVDSCPQKAIQSFVTTPDPKISDPLLTVAAPIYICIRFASSSYSSMVV